jgi:hypothetical protein
MYRGRQPAHQKLGADIVGQVGARCGGRRQMRAAQSTASASPSSTSAGRDRRRRSRPARAGSGRPFRWPAPGARLRPAARASARRGRARPPARRIPTDRPPAARSWPSGSGRAGSSAPAPCAPQPMGGDDLAQGRQPVDRAHAGPALQARRRRAGLPGPPAALIRPRAGRPSRGRGSAAIRLVGLARPVPAMSKAVP